MVVVLSKLGHHPSSIIHQPSTIIHHPSSIIHHPSSIIHHPSSIIHHPSSIIHHPSSIIIVEGRSGDFLGSNRDPRFPNLPPTPGGEEKIWYR
jgi:hypothetical protein